MIELERSKPNPTAFGLGGVAKTVGVAAIVGVGAAHVLATATEKGMLPHVAVEWPQAAPRNKPPTQVATIVHSIGVDGMPTSTITTAKPTQQIQAKSLSPCGEADALRDAN